MLDMGKFLICFTVTFYDTSKAFKYNRTAEFLLIKVVADSHKHSRLTDES